MTSRPETAGSKKTFKEVAKYGLAGAISTTVDYGVLNLLLIVFQIPLIPANLISTTFGGVVSYQLDKRIVFEGRKHSRRRAVTLFVLINASAIYGIQSLVLWLVAPQLGFIGNELVQANIAKIIANIIGGIWAYLLLRRFVFARTTSDSSE